MTTRILVVLVFALGAGSASAQTAPKPADETKPAAIRGQITAADTGKPLRRARVQLVTAERGGPPIAASTNSLGRFEVKDVPPGSYLVSVSRPGYLNTQFGQRHAGDRGLSVDVAAGATIERIDVVLARGGVLAGRITDETGEAFPGVRVDVLAVRYRMGKRAPFPIGVATTDDLGQFRVAGLAPGRYYVAASSTETWKGESKQTFGYAATYFPGTTQELARTVTLAPSEQRTDLQFTMVASRTARVRGRVQREDGQPIPGAQVSLAYSYPGVVMTGGMRGVRADGGGAFEMVDVPPGTYNVSAGGSISTIVKVAEADIDDVVLVSRTGSTVIGSIITADGAPPPFPASGIRVTAEAPSDAVLPRMGAVSIGADWSFKYALGGPFLFRVLGLPAGWRLGAVRLGDKDITDVPWDVPTGGKEIAGLTIVITQSASRVTGSVVDAKGKPTPAATVLVFSEDADQWVPYSRFVRTTRPTADGRFTIAGLPAGTYLAVARDAVEEGQWEDREFLESLRGDAVRFVISDGGSEALSLKVSK